MISLASTTAHRVTSHKQSLPDAYGSQNMPPPQPPFTQNIMHRPIPAPEPNPEPNPGPDSVTQSSHTSHSSISPVDWDELFHAVQQRLAHCVDDALYRACELAPDERHHVTQTEVLACVDAMKQLQVSLTLERQEWQALQAEHNRLQQRQS